MRTDPHSARLGHRFLEVGSGSGYGAALASEVAGPGGLVVTLEIDSITFAFARDNLQRLGYRQVVIIHADGSKGYPPLPPYDRICFTATAPEIPPPLLKQQAAGGRVIGPVGKTGQIQDLVIMVRQDAKNLQRVVLEQVVYIPLRGEFGYSLEETSASGNL